MSRAPVIGIAGSAGSGKDTIASFIIAAIGGYRYGLADPIRSMLVPLGINMTDPYWQAHKDDTILALGVSPRRMMQTLGTEWGRNLINPDLWIMLAHQRLLQTGPGMVIPDIRFENEATWVRKHGGMIIHVVRPNLEPVEAHESEDGIEVLDEDVLLFNSGTLEDLQRSVKELFHGYEQA